MMTTSLFSLRAARLALGFAVHVALSPLRRAQTRRAVTNRLEALRALGIR